MRSRHYLLICALAIGAGCGYEYDPEAEGIYPCDPLDTVNTPQCLDDFVCSLDGFCVRALPSECHPGDEGKTRCNQNVVDVCVAGEWQPDQFCGDQDLACVEVFDSGSAIFACRDT